MFFQSNANAQPNMPEMTIRSIGLTFFNSNCAATVPPNITTLSHEVNVSRSHINKPPAMMRPATTGIIYSIGFFTYSDSLCLKNNANTNAISNSDGKHS